MSKLYREGLKLEKSISHIGFLKLWLESNLVPKGLSFHADDFEKEVANGLKMKQLRMKKIERVPQKQQEILKRKQNKMLQMMERQC